MDKGILENVAQIFAQEGSDAWFTKDIKEFLPKDFTCPKCHKTGFVKEKDILDVWYDSAVSFEVVAKQYLVKIEESIIKNNLVSFINLVLFEFST
jgi:isoleucyl-tRNA synthetase